MNNRNETCQLQTPTLFQEVIKIHPQASTVVCRRVLDLLVALGRYFPNHFLSRSIIESGLKYGGSKTTDEKKVIGFNIGFSFLFFERFWRGSVIF